MPRCAAHISSDTMDDEDDFRFSVVDVYDIAADIGKEFEKIIDQYGPDVLTSLMPRVITALEQLERVAEKQETAGSLIEELRSTISVLEHQKLGQAENRQRYARDLEDIERDMREEKQELSAKVSLLLDENRKLSTCLARSTDNTPSVTDDESSLEPEVARSVMARLQDAVEGQREQLHALQMQLQRKLGENEQLSSQMERVNQSNRDLRRRARQGTQQIRQLVEERAELHVTLQEQQRSLDQLNQRLGLAAKENFDLATAATSDQGDQASKIVYDRNDPNRPRFTLIELKDILYQRNELKARLSDLEDELSVYRPAKQQDSASPSPPSDDSPPNENDPPVQGPMPYEPDDAPWKRGPRESGIRKFFERMKKLSGVVLSSGDAVLGTPTVPSNLTLQQLHRQQQQLYRRPIKPHQQLFHSTPNTANCTPTPSLNVSSPPSLRSLPSKLTANSSSIGAEDGEAEPSCGASVRASLFPNSANNNNSNNSSLTPARESTTTTSGVHSNTDGSSRDVSMSSLGASRTEENSSKFNSSYSTGDISMASIQTSGSTLNTNESLSSPRSGTTSGFSFEKFRSRFGIASTGSAGSSPSNDTDGRPSNLDINSSVGSLNSGEQQNSEGNSSSGTNRSPKSRSTVIQVPPLML